jgi:hypothetical protein
MEEKFRWLGAERRWQNSLCWPKNHFGEADCAPFFLAPVVSGDALSKVLLIHACDEEHGGCIVKHMHRWHV